MKNFLTKHFSIVSENKKLSSERLQHLIEEVETNILTSAHLTISPVQNTYEVTWDVDKNLKSGKLKFKCEKLRYILYDFKNFVLMILRKYETIIILFKNHTGTYIKEDEIIELWGYRLYLVQDNVIMQHISHQELFDSSSDNDCGIVKSHWSNIIYCCPEGKKCGWDKE